MEWDYSLLRLSVISNAVFNRAVTRHTLSVSCSVVLHFTEVQAINREGQLEVDIGHNLQASARGRALLAPCHLIHYTLSLRTMA